MFEIETHHKTLYSKKITHYFYEMENFKASRKCVLHTLFL